MARGVGGKRKRGNATRGRGGGGGVRGGKKDRDKSTFKMRKYTKNSYVIQDKVMTFTVSRYITSILLFFSS